MQKAARSASEKLHASPLRRLQQEEGDITVPLLYDAPEVPLLPALGEWL